jgi:hypothetical protein
LRDGDVERAENFFYAAKIYENGAGPRGNMGQCATEARLLMAFAATCFLSYGGVIGACTSIPTSSGKTILYLKIISRLPEHHTNPFITRNSKFPNF